MKYSYGIKQTLFHGLVLSLLLCIPLWGAEDSEGAPSFWRVEGANNTVWLFGTVHFLTEKHYPLADKVEKAFRSSPSLVVEINIALVDEEQLQATMMAHIGMLPGGRNLEALLGEERYARARELAAEREHALDQMKMLPPWMVAFVLTAFELERLGYSAEHGVDAYFLNRAKAEDKRIVELETLEFQMSLFAELDEEMQAAYLMQTLEELASMEEQIEMLIGAWEEGSLDDLEETLLKYFEEYPGLYKSIVTERNHDWNQKLIEILEESDQDHFVAVGALHMVGEKGLNQLLRRAGYTVQQQ